MIGSRASKHRLAQTRYQQHGFHPVPSRSELRWHAPLRIGSDESMKHQAALDAGSDHASKSKPSPSQTMEDAGALHARNVCQGQLLLDPNKAVYSVSHPGSWPCARFGWLHPISSDA